MDTKKPSKDVVEFDPRADTPVQEPEMSVMRRPETAVGAVSGELSFADLPFPRLQMAYGVGKLAENYNPGDLVLQDEYLLAHKGEPVLFIPVKALVYWKEYLSQELWATGQKPREFLTEKEVHDAGGTTAWVNGVGPTFSKALELRMLIQRPENLVCGLFGIQLGGKEYAPAVWNVDKTAFKTAAAPILFAAGMALKDRGELLGGTFELVTSVRKSQTGNTTAVPVTRLKGINPPELVQEISALFAG